MKALLILESMRELERKNGLSTSATNEAIAELKEIIKSKVCQKGCTQNRNEQIYGDLTICDFCIRGNASDKYTFDLYIACDKDGTLHTHQTKPIRAQYGRGIKDTFWESDTKQIATEEQKVTYSYMRWEHEPIKI